MLGMLHPSANPYEARFFRDLAQKALEFTRTFVQSVLPNTPRIAQPKPIQQFTAMKKTCLLALGAAVTATSSLVLQS